MTFDNHTLHQKILDAFKLSEQDIIAIYPYGSRIYGTATESSDYDFVVVMKHLTAESDQLDAPNDTITINLYSEDSFTDRVAKHRISVLECLFLPADKVIKEPSKPFQFRLNKQALRESISEKASKDFNQCKKRLSDSQGWNPVLNQPFVKKVYEAKKSLFHCFRIIDFGMQIANNGKIVDYTSCNKLWQEIKDNPSDKWEDYASLYKETYNSKMTEFRKVAPK
jgi:predicted nucleotidyltransferase